MNLYRKIMAKSIFSRVLLSIFLALVVIVFLMEMSSFYILKQYRQSAEEMYQNSLELYSSFWSDKMETINDSILSIISYEEGGAFYNICEATDRLLTETSKIEVLNEMISVANLHDNEVCLFAYVPERAIFMRTQGPLADYNENKKDEESVKAYIDAGNVKNNNNWEIMESGGRYYFFQVYRMFDGYIGAYMECRVILQNIISGSKAANAAVVLDKEGMLLARSGENIEGVESIIFENKLAHTDCSLGTIVTQNTLYNDWDYLRLLSFCAVLVGGMIILAVIHFQKSVVFTPLSKLKEAMEDFSEGKIEVRLLEYPRNNEIKILYQTFNHMAEQIVHLKIDNYESMLEKQRIKSHYLRVQIQPHFYTNILNLIYGLAEIRDWEAIQALAVYMSKYFRYLLSEKADFVKLDQELDCVENYVKIQQIRYPENILFRVECDAKQKDAMIPPLLLQTFVENSIKHNITLVPRLVIQLKTECRDEQLIFIILDNGIGFQKEVMEKLNRGEDIEENGKHIGIVNVRKRLELLYGEKASVCIRNREVGSEIVIRIPKREGNKENESSAG